MKLTKTQLKQIIKEELKEINDDSTDLRSEIEEILTLAAVDPMDALVFLAKAGSINPMDTLVSLAKDGVIEPQFHLGMLLK